MGKYTDTIAMILSWISGHQLLSLVFLAMILYFVFSLAKDRDFIFTPGGGIEVRRRQN